MKSSYIIGIVVIAVAIGVIISTAGNASQYVTFSDAVLMAKEGNAAKVHVVGKLKKTSDGKILEEYNPAVNPNLFTFVLIDNNNQEKKVIYRKPKPQDFEKSEQVVIVGSVKNGNFIADEILLKCPSKYQDKKIKE